MEVKIKPALGRILIERYEQETKSGGIILPEAAQEKSTKGKVLAVGSFKQGEELDVSPGDTIYITKWAGTEIEYNGQTVVIIKSDEVLAIEKGK